MSPLVMRLSFDFKHLHETCKRLLNKTLTRNMTTSKKTQMVLGHDNGIIVSKDQQPPMTSTRQPLLEFIHQQIIA